MKNMSVIWWGIGIIAIVGLIVWIASGVKSDTASTAKPALALQGDDHVRGAANPKVVLLEYGDFQCPACGAIEPLVQQLLAAYPNDLAVAYRNFPLRSIHPNADFGARVAEAASLQGKFWEMHDQLYANQGLWSGSSAPDTVVRQFGINLGLDVNKLASDWASAGVKNAVDSDYNGAVALGLNATPTFFLNGQKIENIPGNLEGFKKLIDSQL
jgi:protein-disulfide isomerase